LVNSRNHSSGNSCIAINIIRLAAGHKKSRTADYLYIFKQPIAEIKNTLSL